MEILVKVLQALVMVPLTLLPVINPLGGAPLFMAMAGTDRTTTLRLSRQVAINCWFVIVAAMLVGTYVLAVFGISLPIVRIGGGLLVAAMGWRMLHRQDDDEVRNALARGHRAGMTDAEIVRRSFYPMTFPLTAGPGTIAASIALGATLPRQPVPYLAGALVAVAGATLTVAVVYVVYRNAAALMSRLGEVGTMVMIRLVAFVLLCIGIEITWTGWAELNGLATG